VFSLSGPTFAGSMNAERAGPLLHAPVLLAAADQDLAFADAARALYGLVGSSDRTLAIVPGGAHGTGLLADPTVDALVTRFVERVLG
jgi:hypothetical protein